VCWKVLTFRNQLAWSRWLGAVSFQRLQTVMNNLPVSTGRKTVVMFKKKSMAPFSINHSERVTSSAVAAANPSEEGSILESARSEFNEDKFKEIWYRTRLEYNLLMFVFALVLPVIGPPLIIQLVLPYYGHDCVGCYEQGFLLAIYLSVALLWSVLAAVVGRSLATAPDPLNQIRDMKYGLMFGLLTGGLGQFLMIIDQYIGKPHDLGLFDFDWLILIGNWTTYFFFGPYPMFTAVLRSRKQFRVNIDFKKLLPEYEFQKMFMHHLVNEWSVENLKFYIQVNAFKTHYVNIKNQTKLLNAAKEIHKAFVQRGGVMEVNIPDNLRAELEAIFESDTIGAEGQIGKEVFDKANEEIVSLMETDSFSRFRESKDFKTWAADNLAPNEQGVLVPLQG
jgi:hypothetical protein